MKKFIIFFVSICFSLTLFANNNEIFNEAIKAYSDKDYKKSVKLFDELIKTDSLNPTLHYNLGTAYLRLQNAGLSIYHLEKSLKLNPDNEAARVNLNFAEKLKTTVTKGNLPVPQQQMLYSVFNFMKPNTWATCTIIFMIVAVVLLIAFKFINNNVLKKVLFSVGITTLIISITSYFIAKNQANYLLTNHYVIIKDNNTKLLQEPRSVAKITSNLAEGEKGFITEETDRWLKIQLSNDTIGWVDKNTVLKY